MKFWVTIKKLNERGKKKVKYKIRAPPHTLSHEVSTYIYIYIYIYIDELLGDLTIFVKTRPNQPVQPIEPKTKHGTSPIKIGKKLVKTNQEWKKMGTSQKRKRVWVELRYK